MYSTVNYKSKKALKEAVLAAKESVAASAGLTHSGNAGVACYQPGPFGPDVVDGTHVCEGPHYPAPHRWYAECVVKGGLIVRVK